MKDIKKIIIVSLYMGNGGAERVFSELANYWVNAGIKVKIIQTRPKIEVNNYKLDERIELVNLHNENNKFRRVNQTISLIKILRNEKDSIVIAFSYYTITYIGIVSLFAKNKYIFSERNDPDRYPVKRYQRILRDLLFEIPDLCVFQTIEAKSHFSNRIQKKSFVIHNPINPALPLANLGKRNKIILAAARLEHQKNLPLLIDAFFLFHQKHPDFSLEIYGEGSLENFLREYITSKKIIDSVRLMGFTNNIYSKMQNSAMYVSSSNYEGISNSMLEAIGMGMPTICTDCPAGGARETISEGVNGLLVPVGDVNALYRAMCRIAENPEFAEKLSQNAVKIRDELAIEKIADQWLKTIEM